jgi:hypothetical protein
MNNAVFQSDLLPDEQIVWSGQPESSILFTPMDLLLVPFSLLWGGFAIFWELSVIGTFKSNQPAPAFFPLFGVPFVLVGLYFIFGRFVYKSWKKKRTWYAVTNQRVLIVTQGISRTCQALSIATLPAIDKTVRSNGSGNIKFGTSPFMFTIYENSGMDFFGGFNGQGAPSFFDLKDVESVYRIVTSQRQ